MQPAFTDDLSCTTCSQLLLAGAGGRLCFGPTPASQNPEKVNPKLRVPMPAAKTSRAGILPQDAVRKGLVLYLGSESTGSWALRRVNIACIGIGNRGQAPRPEAGAVTENL